MGQAGGPGDCTGYLRRENQRVNEFLSRVDLFLNTAVIRHAYNGKPVDAQVRKEALTECGDPTVKAELWYGSYFTKTCPISTPRPFDCGGNFLSFPLERRDTDSEHQMMFATSYNTRNPNILPRRGNTALAEVVKEADAIVRNIRYKR